MLHAPHPMIGAPPLAVRADTLVPAQQPSTPNMRRQYDFHEQICLKFSGLGHFHSREEFWNAGLQEGNPRVHRFVPQPFRLRVGKHWYTPDLYIDTDPRPKVIELKPRGEFDPRKTAALTHFFDFYNMDFEVWANETVRERAEAAENWLDVVRTLLIGEHLDTAALEYALWTDVQRARISQVQDLFECAHEHPPEDVTLAFCRLLYRHKLVCDMDTYPLRATTVIGPCD